MNIDIFASKLPEVCFSLVRDLYGAVNQMSHCAPKTYRAFITQFSVALFLVSAFLSKMFDVGDRDLPVLSN